MSSIHKAPRCARFEVNYYNGYKEITLCPYKGFPCLGNDPVMLCYKRPVVEPEIPFEYVPESYPD